MNTQGRKQSFYIDENLFDRDNHLVVGTAAKKLKLAPGRKIAPPKKQSVRHLKNRDRAKYMDWKYVLFLFCALMISGLTLSTYISLQSDITASVKHIARLERELNNLRLANEENHSRIVNNVDLDYIRRVAITELGMVYATEGQIVKFAGNTGDYVRQLNPLP